ncbi:TraI domain-containing protein [Vibrio mediterranei]
MFLKVSLWPLLKSEPKVDKNSHQLSSVTEDEGQTEKKGKPQEVPERYFRSARTILSSERCQYLIREIKELAGLHDSFWERYYEPAINRLAVLCQDAPASERHHHSHEYGLIEHSLEVAMYAMQRSQGCVYMPDREPETIQWIERVFMYCCFGAGLLHDAAKLHTDMRWYIRDDSSNYSDPDGWLYWSPLYREHPPEEELVEYKIVRNQNKEGFNIYNKTSHELFASSVVQDVIPPAGLDWIYLFSDQYCPEIWLHFIHTVASDYGQGSDIGKCVSSADQYSTNQSMKIINARNKGDYIDLSDPNLPIHEAYREGFREVLSDPDGFNLAYNKSAMGKFSSVERYGELVFVSPKSVLPVISKILKAKNVRLPADQNVYTLLSDHGLTKRAPSGDTLWWATFSSTRNNNKPRELSYLVFSVDSFPEITIPDLKDVGVDFTLGNRSLDETLGDFGPSSYPDIYHLLYGDVEDNTETEESQDDTGQVVAKESVAQEPMVASGFQHSRPQESNGPIEQQNVKEKVVGENGGDAKITGENSLSATNPSNGINRTVQPPVQKSAKPSNSDRHSTQKRQKKRGFSSLADKGKHVALGLSGSNSTPKSSGKRKVVAPPHEENGLEQPSGKVVVCKMPVDSEESVTDSVPFNDAKIIDRPVRINIPKHELSKRCKPIRLFNNPSWLKFIGSEHSKSGEYTKAMIAEWLPYLSNLIEKGLLKVNCPGADIYMTQHGAYMVSPNLFSNFGDEISAEFESVLVSNDFTLGRDENTPYTAMVDTSSGERLEGILLAVRVSAEGQALANYSSLKLS